MTGNRDYSNYRTPPPGPGFYIDSGTQREKARHAAEVLEYKTAQHEQWLRQNPSIRYEIANEIASERHTPPPVYRGYEDRGPSTSPDKYAARFRDGLPPPPPPRLREEEDPRFPNGRPRRASARLIPQHEFDAGVRRPGQRRSPLNYSQQPPPTLQPRASLIPEDIMMSSVPTTNAYEPEAALTPSQKKRLRKKRAKLGRQVEQSPPMNGYAPPYPSPDPRSLLVEPTPGLLPQPRFCPSEEIVHTGRTQFRVSCGIEPWPHPGQPHMMELVCDSDPQMHVFIGWWTE